MALGVGELQASRNDNVILVCYLELRDNLAMIAPAKAARPRETLNIRVGTEVRSLIDRAAKARGQNRTDFILDAARRAAEDTLLDRALISVSPKAYAEFLARLDEPAKPNDKLRRTMRVTPPWKAG